ncbi:acyl-CoA thioester hydrolase [Lutibacter oceani]|uniref:Acyl-CoA thioester hydrolase n=1 Tax=Lutibacter oceani TaxID=1853311 RepID=A0A3D9RYS4_9FLAO|nr:thioesterase family protein [Lutibacter oceani]REE81672.1 acyl-CoA thioester hydrolase [Lutibacter oceani]
MENHFNFSFTVDKTSIDNLNHVNNVTYLNWAQTVAEKHWKKISTSSINNKYVWVVIRHEVDYFSSAYLNDEIVLKTWIGESYGVKSDRFVDILKDDKVICSVKTIWCLLDKNSMKPVRIPEEIMNVLNSNKIG